MKKALILIAIALLVSCKVTYVLPEHKPLVCDRAHIDDITSGHTSVVPWEGSIIPYYDDSGLGMDWKGYNALDSLNKNVTDAPLIRLDWLTEQEKEFIKDSKNEGRW